MTSRPTKARASRSAFAPTNTAVDGGESAEFRQIVDRALHASASGRPAALIWDVDGTLMDPRPRMLHVARTYGALDATLDDMAYGWDTTAERLGADPDAFRKVWNQLYWQPQSFDHDVPVRHVMDHALRSQIGGVYTVVLTGRSTGLRAVTDRQLGRHGLKPDALISKHDLSEPTPWFKAAACMELREQGFELHGLVTDSVDEILVVRQALGPVPAVLLVHDDAGSAPSLTLDPAVVCVALGPAVTTGA